MATEEERILTISVDYEKAIKSIAEYQSKVDELKKSENELKQALKDGAITKEQYNQEMAASKIKTQQYNEAIRTLNKEVNNSIRGDKGKNDSLRGLRATLSNLTAEYDNLSKAERESARGKELKEHINQITTELKEAEEGTGRFYRNVGNYMNSIQGAFGTAAQSVMGFGNQLKALMANPFILAIGVIAAAINSIANAIKSSEEQTNRWKVALAPMNAIMDMLQNALTRVADRVLTLVEGANKLWDAFRGLFGADSAFGKSMDEVNEKMTERANLQKNQIAYEKAVREEIVKSAERERDIADLRSKAVEKDKYSAQERIAFLDEAIAKETEQAQKRKELAELNLANLELEASFTENDADMNNRLAEAKAAVVRAETDLLKKTKELKTQRVEALNQIKAETKANEAAAAAAEKAAEAELKKAEAEVQNKAKMTDEEFKKEYDRQRKLAEARLAAVESSSQEELDLKKKLNELMLNEELRQYEEDEEMKAAIREKYRVANLNLDKAYNDEKVKQDEERAQKEIDIEEAKLQAMRTVTGSLTDLMDAIGESSKAAAIASKVVALAQIAIDTGTAISKAVTTSSAKGFWGFLAEVGPFIAAIVSNMAQAIKTVKGAKFATGGDVSGPGTGTSDSIPAMLSNGESVLTARATSMFAPILSAFNQAGGGVPIQGQQTGNQAMGEDMLARAFAKGLSLLPSPVVSVEEITTVSNRVKAIENISRI